MLYTGVNHFNWSVSNYEGNMPIAANVTSLTAHTSLHTKGADTAILAGIAEDCWGINLIVMAGNTDSTIRRQMIDILIDPAAGVGNAGSSWSVMISNLYTNSPVLSTSSYFGYQYYFPLFIKAGTAIGARTQDVVADATCALAVKVVGKPSRPDLVRVGSKVQTIGDTAASTTGVAFTPGTSVLGSYSASMGTLTYDSWWWQVGIGCADGTQTDRLMLVDVAHDATAKYLCMSGVSYINLSTERASKTAFGDGLPIRHAPAGTDVYVRGASGGAPDSNMTAVVYAVS